MPRPKFVFFLVVLSPVLLNGCFSAVTQSSASWHGGGPSPGAKVAAGLADVATSPIQAPLLVVAGVGVAHDKALAEKRKTRVAAIRQDPEVIFREKWHQRAYDDGRDAVEWALVDHTIAFTDPQLQRLYREMPQKRYLVLGNPHCSAEFLRSTWNAMVQQGMYSDWEARESLLRNPSTPIECLEQAAASDKAANRADNLAAAVLERRNRAAAKP